MDQATLERLMIDDALGALPPDVSSLLTAYTAVRPADEAELSRWRQVTRLASRIAEPPAARNANLPAFPRRRIVAWQVRRFALTGATMAACLLLGFHLNTWMTSPAPITPAADKVVTVASIRMPLPGVHDFWSSQRLLATAMSQPEPSQPQLHWLPLLVRTKIGGVQ
jgi:hypothetical protein